MIEDLLIKLEGFFSSSGLTGLGVSFLAGILSSLSPCIYPLIPITLGVVGAASASSRLRGFWISVTFVMGIAFVYTVLGVISSIFGIFLARFIINPVTYAVLSMIFFLLGLSMLGLFKIRIPFFSFANTLPANKGLCSVFFLGAASGFAIIPCNFPVLGAILSLISTRQNILYGGTALFLFSLGYGIILIVLGTFSSLLKRIPRQGPWMKAVSLALGVMLVGIGGYFLIKFILLVI